MKRRGARERLEDIHAAAQDALAFAGGLDEAAFSALPVADRRTYRALDHALAVGGKQRVPQRRRRCDHAGDDR